MNSTTTAEIKNETGTAGVDAAPRPAIKRVLILDGYSSRTLACVRSWGKKNLDFVVGGESAHDMSLFSRYARRKCVYTSPKQDIARFVSDLNRLSREFSVDHILPTSEAAILACLDHEEELLAVPIIPRRHEIEIAFSKMNTLRMAQSVGITVPKTVLLSREDCEKPELGELRFPVVVKSESSETVQSAKTITSGKTFYAFGRAELEAECALRRARGESVLLQEFIDGYGIGVSGVFSEGKPIALIGHRRIRESNPEGGPSALAETIEVDGKLLKDSCALIEAIGFNGPAMVEYKVDRHNGRAYLMEINGRFWGTLPLAQAAGLDLPYIYWKTLTGEEIGEDEKRYKCGIRGRNVVGDTKCLLMRLKGSSRAWPGEKIGRASAIRSYCASFFDRQSSELIYAPDDPLPFLGRLVQRKS
ncbi:MAG TPA: ATP-grasp domain-containing protein [Terracidiphilus sp.]|jgi:predicted ATP-grasp superfamily ATP-dependent carboligase